MISRASIFDLLPKGPFRASPVRLLPFACLLALSGCGGGAGGKTEITFWAFGSEGEHVQALLPAFEKENPTLHVRLQMIPWTAAHEKVLTAYAGSSTPDVCQWGNTWIPELVLLEAVEPLDAWTARTGEIRRGSYFPGIWETNRMDSTLYGVPWYVDTRVLFYRKDIMARAGYPDPPARGSSGGMSPWRSSPETARRRATRCSFPPANGLRR